VPQASADHLHEPLFAYLRRDFTPLRTTQTVEEALAFLRSQQLGGRLIYFYVTDPGGRLAGVIPTRRLLAADPSERLDRLMVTTVTSLPTHATVRDACEAFLHHRYLAFPVVDSEGVLHGVVDVGLFTDEIEKLSERRGSEDVFQLIGVHVTDAVSAWGAFRARVPWLMFNVAGGLAAALIAGLYETLLDAAVMLALFIPVVLALAESVSMQSVTITLQQLHGRDPRWPVFVRAIRREAATAVLLGLACGGLVGFSAWAWKRAAGVALAIVVVITFSMLTACLLGVVLPTALRALERDPRIASGPVVLASADLITLLLYFNLAAVVLR
jgi:magnesium transporter